MEFNEILCVLMFVSFIGNFFCERRPAIHPGPGYGAQEHYAHVYS